MKAYNTNKTGSDGLIYSVRLLLEPDELEGLQRAGVIGSATEIVELQDVVDSLIANFEKQIFITVGGILN